MTSTECSNGDGTTKEAVNRSAVSDIVLSVDATLDLLANHQRREILRVLIDDTDNVVTVDQLTRHLIDKEAVQMGKRPGRNQVETAVYHVHLPKLTDTGVTEYDARSKELRYWRHDRLEEFLDYIESQETD